MKGFLKTAVLVTVLVTAAACTETYTDSIDMDVDGVYAVMSMPERGDGVDTKALSPIFKFTFAEDDRINVFPATNTDEAMTYGLNPDESDATKAEFESKSFTMKDADYTALYPSQTVQSFTAITLPFTGQSQTADSTTAHLSAFDYCWATASISGNKGNFALAHKVAWLKIIVKTTDAANLKSIVVSADEGVANSATINALTGVVTPSRTVGDVLTLSLGGDSGIDVSANSRLIAYITLPAGTYTPALSLIGAIHATSSSVLYNW